MARTLVNAGNGGGGAGTSSTPLTPGTIAQESEHFRGTGGESSVCGSCGFVPAFRDEDTGAVFRACDQGGRPTPVHVLDGLPDEVVISRDSSGRVTTVKASLISGFLLHGHFYDREQAAALIAV